MTPADIDRVCDAFLKFEPTEHSKVFANEEFGLSGARAYAEKYAADLPRHILAGESDFGSGQVWQADSRVAPESLPLFDEVAKLLALLVHEEANWLTGNVLGVDGAEDIVM